MSDSKYKRFTSRVLSLLTSSLIILIGILLALPVNTFFAEQVIGENFNTLDGSWATSLPAALSVGELAGRDFVFTYGPLYQLVHGVGLLIPPRNIASLLRFQYSFEVILVLLGVWLVLKITNAPFRWRAGTYLLWACIWSQFFLQTSAGLKPLGGLFCVAIAGFLLTSRSKKNPTNSLLAALVWSFSAPSACLYSFDLGAIVLIGLLLTLAFVIISGRFIARVESTSIYRMGFRSLTMLLVGLVCFYSIASLTRWNHYLSDSWKLASGYSVTMAVPITASDLLVIALISGSLLVIIALTMRRLATYFRNHQAPPGRIIAVLAMSLYCLVSLRLALTRSDWDHVFLSEIPSFFLGICVLPSYLPREKLRVRWLVLAGIFFLFIPSIRIGITRNVNALIQLEVSAARLGIRIPEISESSMVASTLASDSLYIWPYETVVDAIASKRVLNYTLQSYAATTHELEQRSLAVLEARTNLPVMLFTNSLRIDGVEGLSRTPELFRYFLENYELTEDQDAGGRGFVLLRRRKEKREWERRDLVEDERYFKPGHENSLLVDFATLPTSDCRASDLMTIEIRVARTRLFGIEKPGRTLLTFLLSDGQRITQTVVLHPDGVRHEILVSAASIRNPLFLSVLSSNRMWRATERVMGIELSWLPMDVLTAKPESIAIERISIIRPKNPPSEIIENPPLHQAERSQN